jgi:hypothetical protein
MTFGLLWKLSLPGGGAALTQAAVDHGFDVNQLITAGVTPVAVLILLVTNQLFTKGTVELYEQRAEEAEKRATHAEEQRDFANAKSLDSVVPALTLSTRILERMAPVLQTTVSMGSGDSFGGHPRPGGG